MLITFGYVLVAFMLFNRGTRSYHCPLHRATNVFLALAIFCFGMGRFLGAMGHFTSWLYDVGHINFFAFAVAYLWHGEFPVIKAVGAWKGHNKGPK